MKALKELLIPVLCLALVFAGLIAGLIQTSSMPDVHISNSTGECVRVVNYDARFDYTCQNYPDKYNHIWVQ